MSAPSVEPGQASSEESEPSSQESQPDSSASPRNGFRELAKMAKGLAVAGGMLATLIIGIVIGNSARKRIDRMSHGIQ